MTEKQFLTELKKRKIYYFRSGNNIMLNCIFHNEKNPSMGVNFKKYTFQCFSCGVTGNILKLERALFEGEIEEDFEEEGIVDEVLKTTAKLRHRIDNINMNCSKMTIKILINFDIEEFPVVKNHIQYTEYLYNRKINSKSWKKWNIRCGEWKGVERILIPMYDEYKRLVAIYGRAIQDDKDIRIRKSKHADVGKILFGLEHLKGKKKVVLVEGELDTIYLQQFGIPAISLGTKRPTECQLMKMAKYFSKVFLSLDGDVPKRTYKKGKNIILGVNDILREIAEAVPVRIIKLPKDKDPNELTTKEVKDLYKEFIK